MCAAAVVEASWRKATFRAMGGPCDIRAWCVDTTAITRAIAEIRRLECKYSRYLPDSVTSRINAAAGRGRACVDFETAALLSYADDAWQASGGMFDITSGVLRRAWDFRRQRFPRQADIDAILPLVGWEKARYRGDSVQLAAGMEIDFGGIVKEYAADRVADVLRRHGIHHALVELAGDIAVTGPLPDGSPWRIRVRHPRNPGREAGVLELTSGAVATSGDYERCIIKNGKRYSHILDPRTGWPVAGLASVTVRHSACTVAGTLATVAMLKGGDGAAWLAGQDIESVCIPA